jgi:hypothetical protein
MLSIEVLEIEEKTKTLSPEDKQWLLQQLIVQLYQDNQDNEEQPQDYKKLWSNWFDELEKDPVILKDIQPSMDNY